MAVTVRLLSQSTAPASQQQLPECCCHSEDDEASAKIAHYVFMCLMKATSISDFNQISCQVDRMFYNNSLPGYCALVEGIKLQQWILNMLYSKAFVHRHN